MVGSGVGRESGLTGLGKGLQQGSAAGWRLEAAGAGEVKRGLLVPRLPPGQALLYLAGLSPGRDHPQPSPRWKEFRSPDAFE